MPSRPSGPPGTRVLAVATLDQTISNVRNWIVGIAASVATVYLTWGGLRYMMAGGEPGEVEKAKSAIRSAAVGYADRDPCSGSGYGPEGLGRCRVLTSRVVFCLSCQAAGTSRRGCRGRAGITLACLLVGIAAAVILFGTASAQADPAPVPARPLRRAGGRARGAVPTPVTPGIYGPLIGGGTMAPPTPPDDADMQQSSDPSWYDIPGQIEKAINTWLGNIVKAALEPVLHFVGATVLSSPDVSDGRIAQVWTMMLVTANADLLLFVLDGGSS